MVLGAVALLTLGSLVVLAPLGWMLGTSLKPFAEVFESGGLWPRNPRPANYAEALGTFDFLRAGLNSALVAALVVAGTLFSAIPAGYAFAHLRVRGGALVFALLLGTLMLPAQVTIVPLFRLFAAMGMVDTYAPLVLPAWFGTNAFAVFLLRQFFRTIPRETIEAARIDGASEGGILVRVCAPLARPALVTVAVFAFLGSWNDLWGPLVFLHREEKATLPLALANFVGGSATAQGTPWNLVMAAAAISILPTLLLFALAQKSFLAGISTSGLK